ncbi:NAD(+)--dinitrogen-reductase ADP-D-ribosyltransferase [Ectothiorhodospira lacustris]|uniref:NAD(+)--dinitrogen-reductase ADP-D-ribosyltransferase n=1 Tax=Ectothiorhodospira lacustris TaxID=2899127 RepID=UPI001EE8C7F7|nr:NAD(+)--dinitrogen-reductase ADP-D-ribosyltransferase [Ectothiorhodospira lacustris]MCG5510477.1 NAD(+)--dinitrogen-reductase ADP-D-ribosyltransferase [Ectothiorhodospira lacustris]MCG5522223.1 NAD(+)--dinitrogen-reductase ADP-D-ribosyltransferase [Ectothiorhodospira lacustris]
MDNDTPPPPSLPAEARLPINRCNLPAVILGSLTFQDHPAPLELDGVRALHGDLWRHLDGLDDAAVRIHDFMAYMRGHFCLDDPVACGLTLGEEGGRARADYLRTLRGWWFNPDGREAAVVKGWVESRFGLITRFHREPLPDAESEAYGRFMQERVCGVYNTNALESQLDLLYSYTQYELRRRAPARTHLTLYRGVNRLADHEVLAHLSGGEALVLLNNVNAFSAVRERADEFGDYILTVKVPTTKVCCFQDLLPGVLQGEGEHLVIGGVYRVKVSLM